MKSSILLITKLQGHKQCIANTEESAVGSNQRLCLPKTKQNRKHQGTEEGQRVTWKRRTLCWRGWSLEGLSPCWFPYDAMLHENMTGPEIEASTSGHLWTGFEFSPAKHGDKYIKLSSLHVPTHREKAFQKRAIQNSSAPWQVQVLRGQACGWVSKPNGSQPLCKSEHVDLTHLGKIPSSGSCHQGEGTLMIGSSIRPSLCQTPPGYKTPQNKILWKSCVNHQGTTVHVTAPGPNRFQSIQVPRNLKGMQESILSGSFLSSLAPQALPLPAVPEVITLRSWIM